MSKVCEHGSLERSCEVCELKAELAKTKAELDEADDRWKNAEDANIKLTKKLASLRMSTAADVIVDGEARELNSDEGKQ